MLVSKGFLLFGQKEANPRGWEGGRALDSKVENFFPPVPSTPSHSRQAPTPCRGGRQRGDSITDVWAEGVLKWFEWNIHYLPLATH